MLRGLRLSRDVPLRVVAAAAEMDSTLLSKVELNQRIPTSQQTAALARFFGVPLVELEAKRIATKFRQDFGESAVANEAVLLLHEQAGKYRTRKIQKRR
jgi:transcriptional regulator with XRE-family HTH domain